MDGNNDEMMDTKSEVPTSTLKINENGFPSSSCSGVHLIAQDGKDVEMTNDLKKRERLFDEVFGISVIFWKLEKNLSYSDLKNCRLVRRSANNSVLNNVNFSEKTRFVVKWKTLKGRVLIGLQFPLVNVDVHLFRAAATESVAHEVRDVIRRTKPPYKFRKARKSSKGFKTRAQIWDPNCRCLNLLYERCCSVKQLRVFGVKGVESTLMEVERTLQILPSVHRLIANIKHLDALRVDNKLFHWPQSVRKMKPSVSPDDAEASKQALMSVKTLECHGCKHLLPKLFGAMIVLVKCDG